MKGQRKMNERLNRKFNYGQKVYIAQVGSFAAFKLISGSIIGIRKFKTPYSDFIYTIETALGLFEALPAEIYTSVDDFKAGVEECVVE